MTNVPSFLGALTLEWAALLIAGLALLHVLRRQARLQGRAALATRVARAALVLVLSSPFLVRALASGSDGTPAASARTATSIDGSAGAASSRPPATTSLTASGSTAAARTEWIPHVLLASLAAAWGACGAVALTRLVRRWRRLRRLLLRSVVIRRIGKVHVRVSDETGVPFSTAAFGRADVVLPTRLLEDPRDMQLTVRHELHHHRRRDTTWALVIEGLRVAFAWHPAMRTWTRELSAMQELACDEELLRRGTSAADYSRCLVRVARRAIEATPVPVASASMLDAAQGSTAARALGERISRLVEGPRRPAGRAVRVASIAAAALAVLLAAQLTVAALPELTVGTSLPAASLATQPGWTRPADTDPDAKQRWLVRPVRDDTRIIRTLQATADDAGLEIQAIRPRRLEQHDGHEVYPIVVEVSGSLVSVKAFSAYLEGRDRLYRVLDLSARRTEPTANWSTRITLATYIDRPRKPTASPPTPAGQPGSLAVPQSHFADQASLRDCLSALADEPTLREVDLVGTSAHVILDRRWADRPVNAGWPVRCDLTYLRALPTK